MFFQIVRYTRDEFVLSSFPRLMSNTVLKFVEVVSYQRKVEVILGEEKSSGHPLYVILVSVSVFDLLVTILVTIFVLLLLFLVLLFSLVPLVIHLVLLLPFFLLFLMFSLTFSFSYLYQ